MGEQNAGRLRSNFECWPPPPPLLPLQQRGGRLLLDYSPHQGAWNLMNTVFPAVCSSKFSRVSSTAFAEATRPRRTREIFMMLLVIQGQLYDIRIKTIFFEKSSKSDMYNSYHRTTDSKSIALFYQNRRISA